MKLLNPFSLVALAAGSTGLVDALNLENEEAERLRRVGIREGSRISVISKNQPMLVQVENTRLAISHRLASQVQILLMEDGKAGSLSKSCKVLDKSCAA